MALKKRLGVAPRLAAVQLRTNTICGSLGMPQSRTNPALSDWTEISSLAGVTSQDSKEVKIRGRVHNIRKIGKKLCFMTVRRSGHTIQVVLAGEELSAWGGHQNAESIVDITGTVKNVSSAITSCSIMNCEIKATKAFIVSKASETLPFQLDDASDSTDISVLQDTRLDNRWLDMRTPANNAIWKLQSRVGQYFREHLLSFGFTEIHTPKIIPTASEGGSAVFPVQYHSNKAYLAQSPQLYKQMAIQGDMMNIFEIGPVFRAENANTHRHLCEFVGLDLEMEIKEHYYEILDVAEGLFNYIFGKLTNTDSELLEMIRKQHSSSPFLWALDESVINDNKIGVVDEDLVSKDLYGAIVLSRTRPMLRLTFENVVKLLNDNRGSDHDEIDPLEDLSTPSEKRLGSLIKERYNTDFYIVDRFPLAIRPFYTMPSPDSPLHANSYDIFMRGEEISSGAQRVHDPELLTSRAEALGVDIDLLVDYINSFKQGAWPHGGFGVGLERVVMLFMGLSNIRSCSMFPRDPKRRTP